MAIAAHQTRMSDGYVIELCNAEQRRGNVAACPLEDVVWRELLSLESEIP